MKYKSFLKSSVLVAASALLPLSQSALAGSEGTDWSISGWINEAAIFYDDTVGSDVVISSDNGTTLGSRITLSGATDLANTALRAGFEVILQPQANQTPLIFSNQNGYDTSNGYDIGVLGTSVNVSGDFGKVTVGLQSMPTDNIAVLADPSLTLWSGISPVFRFNGFSVVGSGGNAIGVWGDFLNCYAASGLRSAGGIGIDCNGIYRQGIRYDLPALGPVSVAVGYANDDIFDVAAKYNGQLGRVKTIVHLGYAQNNEGGATAAGSYDSSDNFQMQIGLMDAGGTGLFGTFAYQLENADGLTEALADETDAYYFKFGIKKTWINFLGDTAIYGEYGSYNDQYGDASLTGSEVERIGFSVDQYYGTNLIIYGKYENLDLTVSGDTAGNFGGPRELNAFTLGLTYFF